MANVYLSQGQADLLGLIYAVGCVAAVEKCMLFPGGSIRGAKVGIAGGKEI